MDGLPVRADQVGFPSPFKSPMATDSGPFAIAYLPPLWKLPRPSPAKSETPG